MERKRIGLFILIALCCLCGRPGLAFSQPVGGSTPTMLWPGLPQPLAAPPLEAPSQTIGDESARAPVGLYASPAGPENPLLLPDPYQVERLGRMPGWFANLELGVVKPRIKSRVTSATPLSPALSEPVELTVAELDWTVAPELEIGYRLAEGRGDLRFRYRLIVSDGAEDFSGAGGPVSLKSHLNVNLFDLDYLSAEWLVNQTPDLFRDLRCALGVRVISADFDSRETGGQILDERWSSHFVGAGPRVQLQWLHELADTSWSLYANLEAAGAVGATRQNFTDFEISGVTLVGGQRQSGSQANGVAIVRGEAGVCWTPYHNEFFRVIAGYQWERFWNLGRTDDSNAELTDEGFFLRGELRY